MDWQKLGRIFCPNNNFSWMVSHAANPFAEKISEQIVRIYFTCRDAISRSHVGYIDVDFKNDFEIVNMGDKPVIAPGLAGTFDDSGTAMGYLINVGASKFLYYLGWNLKVTVPWLNTIGLAIWNDSKQNFEKNSMAPLLDRSNEDPYTISYPSVLFDNGIYRMWYGSNLKWGKTSEEMDHVIKYAESKDGVNWNRTNKIHIDLNYPEEYALSKPYVVKSSDNYEMWYSYRGHNKSYRIGYATSNDGNTWVRNDKAGIDIAADGWDSEMICYPCIFDFDDKRYMLYNGNGYGKTGVGIAVLNKE